MVIYKLENNYNKCGYYGKIKYDIFTFMNNNNIQELIVWCCNHTLTRDGCLLNHIKPSKYVIKIHCDEARKDLCYDKKICFYKVLNDGTFGTINRISDIQSIGDANGAYITFNQKDCEKEYNNQLYKSINEINKLIDNLKQKEILLTKKIKNINNKFIETDYTMEYLTRNQ